MTATSLDALVSPFVGIVRSVEERLVAPADARMPLYTAELAGDERLLGGTLDHVGVLAGMGLDHRAAVDATVGEAAERYSLSYLPTERLVHATAAELGPSAVEPTRFALFAPSQYARESFPFVPFTRQTRTAWIDGWDVASREPAWLPAELVLLADAVENGTRRIGYATSSGAACSLSEDEALLRALLELCERDAFMIVWAARLSLRRLDWSGHTDLDEIDRRYFAPTGLRYAAVDLSCFHGIPSVLGVVRADGDDGAALGVGAGTAPTVGQAWWKALSEAFGTRASARARLAAGEGRGLAADGANVLTLADHILFHALDERASISAFLDASPNRVDPLSIPPLPGPLTEQLSFVASRIEAAGSRAYAIDVTAPDIRDVGLRVVKTLAPELAMLDVPHSARFLGSTRLRRVPVELGLVERPLDEGDLNHYPHPFP